MVGTSDASAYGVDTVVLGEDTAAWEADGAVEREDAVVYAAMHGMEGHPSTEITSVNELLIGWGSATLYPPFDPSEARGTDRGAAEHSGVRLRSRWLPLVVR